MTLMTAEDMYGLPVASLDLFFRSDERRARDAQTLALLPRQHYDSVLELGCGTGGLARLLALRADGYIGIDVAAEAVANAGLLRLPFGEVQFLQGDAGQIPRGPFDLVVVSDWLAGMTPEEISALALRLGQVAPEADVVCVSDIAPGEDTGGSRAPALLARALGWPLTASHVGRGFRIDVFGAAEGPAALD
ncbi:MAG: class I SAM-dependent methyltransferase [Cereibacter changlensis]